MKDPKFCQFPHCMLKANGHDWILMQREDGSWVREGYCSHFHAKLSSDMLYGLPHKLVLESDPRDNEEDRVLLEAQELKRRRDGGGG